MKTNRISGPVALAITVFVSIIALAIVLTSCSAPKVTAGSRFIQTVNKPITIHVNNAAYDTIDIVKADLIAGVTILPNGTDTVKVLGGVTTWKGYAAGYVPVPMTGVGIGYNDLMRIDSLHIMIKKGDLLLTPAK